MHFDIGAVKTTRCSNRASRWGIRVTPNVKRLSCATNCWSPGTIQPSGKVSGDERVFWERTQYWWQKSEENGQTGSTSNKKLKQKKNTLRPRYVEGRLWNTEPWRRWATAAGDQQRVPLCHSCQPRAGSEGCNPNRRNGKWLPAFLGDRFLYNFWLVRSSFFV